MNHKKVTVAGIVVTMLFSFGTLRPMKDQKKKKKADPKQTMKKKADPKQTMLSIIKEEEKAPTIDEEIKLDEKTFKKETKASVVSFDNLDNILIFNDLYHLKELCLLQKNLMDYRGLSKIQKTGKLAKKGVDWVPTIACLVTWWSLNDATKSSSNLKKLIVPALAVTTGATYWFTKGYLGNVIEKWDKKAQTGLCRKQVALDTSLDKIDSNFEKNLPEKDPLASESIALFKSIALFNVLKTQTNKSKNFEPCGNTDIKKKYEEKMGPVTKWLQSLTETKNPLEPFMKGAHEKINSLMDVPPTPEIKNELLKLL